MPLPYLTKLIKKLAPRVGARVIIEPEWGYVAQIIYKNGVVRSLRHFSLDLNRVASSGISKDKDYAKFFLKRLGYPVAPGITVFEKRWAQTLRSRRNISFAVKYAKKLSYPIIVKPNSKSQGTDVHLARDERALRRALTKIFKGEKVALIEKCLPGRDYRIVVLDREVISAYERTALSVIGDGRSSIRKLLAYKQKQFVRNGRDTSINFRDERMQIKLKQAGYNWRSALKKGEKVFLLDNANLSTGGDSMDVTKTMHPAFGRIAIAVTKKMGLRLCGIDIMITSGDITQDPRACRYYIIETNAAPGLDHYVTTGRSQRKMVEVMYFKIMRALGKRE